MIDRVRRDVVVQQLRSGNIRMALTVLVMPPGYALSAEQCKVCGWYGAHDPECPVIMQQREFVTQMTKTRNELFGRLQAVTDDLVEKIRNEIAETDHERRETFVDGRGRNLYVHRASDDCFDNHCCIHNPSDHPLRAAPLVWRQAGIFDWKPSHMERMCEHGVGHPDPDSLAFLRRNGKNDLAEILGSHGCDGCCH